MSHQEESSLPRSFKGIWIPREMWLRRDLSGDELLLWAEIDSLTDPEKGCTATNEYFCQFFKWPERKIQRGIERLKKLGLVSFELKEGKKRTLRSCLKLTPSKMTPYPVKNDTLQQAPLLPPPLYPPSISPQSENKEEIENKTKETSSIVHNSKKDEKDAAASSLASQYLDILKKVSPKISKKKNGQWTIACKKLLALREIEVIKSILEFALKDKFWFNKVLEPQKLLKHLDAIEMEIQKKDRSLWNQLESLTRSNGFNAFSSANGTQAQQLATFGSYMNTLKNSTDGSKENQES